MRRENAFWIQKIFYLFKDLLDLSNREQILTWKTTVRDVES